MKKFLVTIRSDVKLTGGKKNPQADRVTKIVTDMLVALNEDGLYGRLVREGLQAEGKDPGDYVAKPRRWGTRVGNTAIIEHNGQQYLDLVSLEPGSSHYYLDGELIAKEDVIGLPKHYEAEQGGLEKKVTLRTVKLDNVVNMAEVD